MTDNPFADLPPVSQQPMTAGPAGANPFADLPPISQQGAQEASKTAKPAATGADRQQAAEAGILKGLAYTIGGIPDTISNAGSLGTALYDAARHYVGGTDWADLPRPHELSPVGGAITKLMDKSPITTTQIARPDDAASRYLAATGSVIPGVAAGSTNPVQAGKAFLAAAPGAAAAQGVMDVKPFKSEQANANTALLAQVLAGAPTARAKGELTKRGEIVQRGQDLGLEFPAATVNPGGVNRTITTIAGKQNVQQHAQLANRDAQNRTARRIMGLDENTDPITPQDLAAAKAEAAKGRNALRGAGQINTPANFDATIDGLLGKNQGAARVVPGLKDTTLEGILSGMKGKKSFDAADGVDAISALRDKANTAYRAGDAGAGAAYKGAAKALEDAMEQHLAASKAPGAGDLLQGFRDSRTRFAQIGAIEDSLSSAGNVQGNKLAKHDDRGAFTGDLKTMADSAAQDPNAFKEPSQSPGSHHLSFIQNLVASALGGGAAVHGMHSGLTGTTAAIAAGGAVIPAARWTARNAALGNYGTSGLARERQRQLDLARVLGGYSARRTSPPDQTN